MRKLLTDCLLFPPLSDQPGRTLECWSQVQNFKDAVARAEKVRVFLDSLSRSSGSDFSHTHVHFLSLILIMRLGLCCIHGQLKRRTRYMIGKCILLF